MNIGGSGQAEARKDTSSNSTLTPSANLKEVPLGFYDHLAMYVTPHISEDRQSCIAKAAYHRAENRQFVPGHELDDWLAAEEEFDQRLAGEGCVY